MIDEREVRVGIWVHRIAGDYEAEDYQLTKSGVCDYLKSNDKEKKKYYNEIPLTEEWLEKFGFKSDIHQIGEEFIKEGTKFSVFNHPEHADETHSQFSRSFGGIDLYFKYVHHLQNVFYALTGTELTIQQPQHT